MQVLTAEIGPERGASKEPATGEGESDEAAAASEAAANVAQGQATQATTMGAALKDFLTTPQVFTCQPTFPFFLPSTHPLPSHALLSSFACVDYSNLFIMTAFVTVKSVLTMKCCYFKVTTFRL